MGGQRLVRGGPRDGIPGPNHSPRPDPSRDREEQGPFVRRLVDLRRTPFIVALPPCSHHAGEPGRIQRTGGWLRSLRYTANRSPPWCPVWDGGEFPAATLQDWRVPHPAARYFIPQLAESYLTPRGQMVGRIERLAWHA